MLISKFIGWNTEKHLYFHHFSKTTSMIYSIGCSCTCSCGVLFAEYLSKGSENCTAFCTTTSCLDLITTCLQVSLFIYFILLTTCVHLINVMIIFCFLFTLIVYYLKTSVVWNHQWFWHHYHLKPLPFFMLVPFCQVKWEWLFFRCSYFILQASL